ncbi:MAG TPA: hypothetical protein VKC66_10945 [Xanthobacteraceae bacterium]|nr:hypothetical protein [Xanthobacteraceae bacterium]
MSRDDLEWVFGGEVDFADAESQQPLLSLEVPLLGFARDLAGLVGQLHADGRFEIPDRYGSYRLIVTVQENEVNVRDVARDGAFQVERSQLESAIGDFAESLKDSLIQLFPELSTNPEFSKLYQEISDLLSTN